MHKHFPLHFTLDDGTEVTVNKTGDHLFDFVFKDEKKSDHHFRYDDTETFTDEKEAALNFDQLNALRRFWLEMGR